MIQKLFVMQWSKNLTFDLKDLEKNKRIEVKFSTVMKTNQSVINSENVIEECINANLIERMIKSTDVKKEKFDCNIQQIKPQEFDILYYGLFFKDKIAIFNMNSSDVYECEGYSNHQHRGNKNEGQFHINNVTFDWHINNNFLKWFTYEDLYLLFKKICNI
ncbi:MAG: hypothetical protein ACTTJO_02105 [Metamycoplasmataceae bacterium]